MDLLSGSGVKLQLMSETRARTEADRMYENVITFQMTVALNFFS